MTKKFPLRLILLISLFVSFEQIYSQVLSATQSQTNVLCNGSCTGSATVNASGGTAPYTYSWAPSGGTAATASGRCAGTYTCTITDANGTSITKNFTITQPPALTATTGKTNVLCNGQCTGSATVTPFGGTAPYTYSWAPSGGTSNTTTGRCAGTYTCTITDANGCVATRTLSILQPTALATTGSQTNVSCFGGSNGSATVTPTGGTGAYVYSWAPSGGTASSTTGRPAGTYTVTVTDANGCTTTRTYTLTQPSSPVSGSTVVTNIACFGGSNGSINLTPSGGTGPYTYNWLPSGPTTEDRTGLVAGTYSVQITDANGCTGTVTATVTQPSSPVSGTTVVTNVACFGGSNGAINLTPSGGTGPYTYNWLPSGPTTEDRTGLTPGTYSVQITDANGCTGTVAATVTQPAAAVSASGTVMNIDCFGEPYGAIDLTPSGGTAPYIYNWGGGITTEDRTGLPAGTYTCIVTDANSCTATFTATVTQPSAPLSGSTIVTNVSCFGASNGAIDLTPSGGTPGYTYNWGGGITTQDRTGLTAGNYTVVVKDANFCTEVVLITITQPSAVSGSAVVTNVACFGGSNGAINFTPSGGTSPYTYVWSPSGQTTEDRTGLVAGTYTVVTTDANGCTGTVTATVTQPSSAVSGSTVVTNVACFGGSNGAINLTPSGGTGPYTYNWLPSGPTTEDRTGLIAGTYSVQITDANGCTATVSATVTQPSSAVSGSTVVTNVACFGGSNGAINFTPSGGTGPYTYNWLPSGPTTEDRTGLIAGTYSVQIIDANGCTATVSATVTQPDQITGTTFITNETCPFLNNGQINLNVTGGEFPYTFLWNDGNTSQSLSGVSAGSYTVTITDANGCTTTATASVTEPAQPTLTATSITNVSCFGGNSGAITLTPSGGTPPYVINWSDGATGDTRTGLTAGTYMALLEDAFGCASNVLSVTITQPAAITNSISATACDSYILNSQTYVSTGTYTQILTSTSGCDSTLTLNLTINNSSASTINATACDSYTLNATTYTASGAYTQMLTNAAGCDSTITLNLTINNSSTSTLNETACDSYTLNSTTYTVSGTYTQMLTNVAGCDSTITLNLTINNSSTSTLNETACDSYTLNSTTYTVSGTYTQMLTDVAGCDSTITLNLIINNSSASTISPIACDSYTLNSTVYTSSGTYTQLLTNTAGCDSTITLNLTINNSSSSMLNETACDSYTLNSTTYTVSGTYTQVLTNAAGCDSAITLNLTINNSSTSTLNETACDSYTLNSTTYTVSGTYTQVLTNAAGCDSIITLNLTIDQSPVVSFTVSSDTLCADDGALTLTASPAGGTFIGTGVSGNSFDPAIAGNGTNLITYTYTDSSTSCSASATDSIYVDLCTGFSSTLKTEVNIYPNPSASGVFNVSLNSKNKFVATVTDSQGKIIRTVTSDNADINFTVNVSDFANGIYFLKLESENETIVKKLIKNQ